MICNIGDVFTLIRNGANIKQGDDNSGYPITRIETISNRIVDRNKMGYAGVNDITKYADYILADGDILMSHINSEKHLGKVAVYEKQVNETIIHGMNLLCLRPNHNIINYRYAFYFLSSSKFLRQIPRITKKSVNQASFNVAALKELQIYVPSMEEQLSIVDVLDKIQILFQKRQAQIVAMEQLIKSRFIELFGDLADPNCQWKKEKIVDVCRNPDDIKCGPFGTQLSKDEYYTSGVAVWEIPQINSGFTTQPIHFLTVEKANQLEAYSLRSGDIAMSRKGNVGRCAVFPETMEDGIIHSDVLRIRINNDLVLPVFLMHQLHYSGAVQHQIELVSSGAIMAGINVTKLKQIVVHIPPMELQQQFAAFVAEVDKSKLAVQKSLEELETLKKSLMQEYFG